MNALAAILDRPRTVLTFMLVMVVAGAWSYITLPKEARPDIQVPVLYISIPLEGVSPEDAERLLIKPMEQELRGVEGLKEMTAIAAQGHAAIIVEFEADFDPELASQKVREKVDVAKAELPAAAEEPVVNEINLSLFPTILVTLSGNVPERTLYRHARALQDELESIGSVLEVRLSGNREELLEVVIDELRLESYGLSQGDLVNAVQRNNRLIAAGALDTGEGRFSIKVPGLVETAADIYSLPVKVSGERVVTLSDVADIRRTFKDPQRYARFNGRPAITLEVVKRIGSNIIATNERVREITADVTASWPPAIHVDFALDESQWIYTILDSLGSSLMTAIVLVMIVVVAALGLRSALLVGVSIPTSFLMGFVLIYAFGMSVNNMLLFGMVLTVGILVDGAIIVVEYADRKMAEGLDRRAAYLLAAQRMFWPITSSTATTLAAFLPMLFWPGVSGKFMAYLPTTVIIVLVAALVTAMVFLPTLGRMFGGTEQADSDSFRRLAGEESGNPAELGGITGYYVRFLQRLIAHPAKVVLVAVLVITGVVAAFARYNAGVEFFVDTEPQEALVFVRGRGNMSNAQRRDLVGDVEALVLDVAGVRSVAMQAGAMGGGGPDASLGAGMDVPRDTIGQLMIELEPYENRRPGEVILQEIRDRAAALPGIFVEVRKRDEGPATGKDIRLQIRADDRQKAFEAARRVRAHMERGMTGLVDIEDETPLPGIEWAVTIDREEAGRFGADIQSVGALVQLVTEGLLVDTYRPDDAEDEVDIRLRLPPDQRSVSRLDELRLQTPNGLVPITNFTSREARPAVDTLFRTDGRPSVYVKANTAEGVLADDKVRELSAWINEQAWPQGVDLRFRGADEEQQESAVFLSRAMLAALFMMFMILVTQFNSIWHSLITLSSIGLSLVGILIGMLVMGQTFSVIMTGTGIVALAGIVVNNSIVLIDTYHRMRGLGMPVEEAVLKTAAQRLRPVMLTTITTIFGLLPMVLQLDVDFIAREVNIGSISSSWWVHLSTAIVFGLSFATLLTLVLTPVLLAAPDVYRRAWAGWRARRRAGTGPAVETGESVPRRGDFADAAE